MILVNSIMDTIDKCSIFLFLEGSDVNNNKTPSPWLYFENNVANHYDNELDIKKHHLFEDCKPILFPIKTSDFYRASTLEEVFNILK